MALSKCPACSGVIQTNYTTWNSSRTYLSPTYPIGGITSNTIVWDDVTEDHIKQLPIIQSPVPILAKRGIALSFWNKNQGEVVRNPKKDLQGKFILKSINQPTIIKPYMKAKCQSPGSHPTHPRFEGAKAKTPDPTCSCGWYAVPYKGDNSDDSAEYTGSGYVTAHVELSGRVIECGDKQVDGQGTVFVKGYRAEWQRVLAVDIPTRYIFSHFAHMCRGWKKGGVSKLMHKIAEDIPGVEFNLLVPRKGEETYACRTYRAGSPSEVRGDKPAPRNLWG